MSDAIGEFGRSWRLIKASTRVLRDDGELLLLPILSGVTAFIACGALIWQAATDGTFAAMADGDTFGPAAQGFYVWLFGFYIVQYFITFFFNTALVGGALTRLDGRDPTVRSSLAIAGRRVLSILGYAIFSATVGILLRMIGDRGGFVGRLIAGGLDLAWTSLTFMVVPVLVAEDVGPWDAIERSGELLRRTWGSNVIGGTGISLALGFAAIPVALAAAGGLALYDAGSTDAGIALAGIGAASAVGLVAFGSALSAVYTAAVYYYAVGGTPPEGFDDDLVRDSFALKPATD